MTLDIEEMKRDREAGTPGPWAVRENPVFGDWWGYHDPKNWDGKGRLGLFVVPADTHHGKPNARRIARVPEMESRILSDADRIAQLERERDEAYKLLNSDNLNSVLGYVEDLSNGDVLGSAHTWIIARDDALRGASQPEANDEALRERVAKAIANTREGGWPSDTYAMQQQHYFAMADAAIRAVRGDQ